MVKARARRPVVAVTGASGYLGRHVLDVVKPSYEVIALVSPRTRRPIPGTRTRHLDITQGWDEDLRRALSLAGQPVDALVHLAAATSVGESWRDPEGYFRVNARGTERLATAAREMGIDRFVLASSVAVYGAPPDLPAREDSPLAPTSPYGESKVRAEAAAEGSLQASDTSLTVLRLTNLAGSSTRHRSWPRTGVLPAVADALACGRPVDLQGGHQTADGTAVRDFLHVCDAAQAVGAALQARPATPLYANVASGTGTSLLRAANALCRRAGGGDVKIVVGDRTADASELVFDVTTAQRELAWTPTRTCEEILDEEWKYACEKAGVHAGVR